MEYKGFDFTMFIQGQAGNDILMGIIRTDRPATNKLSLFYTDRWTPENPNASRPSATVDAKYWNSDQMLFNGSFLNIIFPLSLFILIFVPAYFVETIFFFILFQWLCMIITEITYLIKNYK